MIILDHQQGTEEWFAARLGKPSASNFGKLITATGKPSSSSDGYINQLIAERLTGKSEPFYVNEHMARGTELEPEAREAYEFITGYSVTEHGFILDDSKEFGCSPDGIIEFFEENAGIEIKCPAATTMVKYLRDPQALVKAYYQQIQGCLWVTNSQWWDAFAYHPEMPHVLVRVERDEEFITKLAVEVEAAVIDIKNQVEQLR
tara:strand:+ start:969 stop:1577 length:609 start_codon:yes stop_codon:yes gene_type:complete